MAKQIIDGFIGRDDVFVSAGPLHLPGVRPVAPIFAAAKTNTEPENETDPSVEPENEPEVMPADEPNVKSSADDLLAQESDSSPEPSDDTEPNDDEEPSKPDSSEAASVDTEEPKSGITPDKDPKVVSSKPKHDPRFRLKHPKTVLGLSGLVLLIVILVAGSLLYFRGKALPGSQVLGSSVAGMTRQQLADFISHKQADFKPTIASGKKQLTPKLSEIGLSYDSNQTIDQVMSVHRSGSLFDKLAWWQTKDSDLSVSIDKSKLAKYLKTHVKSAIVQPVSAKLAFDDASQQFKVTPDKSGKGIDVDEAASSLVDSARTTRWLNLKVSTTPIPAKLKTADLSQAQANAQAYVDTNLRLVASDKTFVPTATQKASWLKLSPDEAGRTYKISVDKNLVQNYVNSSVATLNKPMEPKLTIDASKDKPGGVLQAGQDGRVATNTTQLASAMSQAFSDKQSYEGKINLKVQKASTKSMKAYPKWIYVSLSQQRLTAYEYAKPMKSFLISSGTVGYETEVGVFKVWYKVPVQTMKGGSLASGDYYDLPNVHWDTYFNGDAAIHEAYWHNNFGHPMSHGCLNATYANAKWIFDWAPLGTTVVVQN